MDCSTLGFPVLHCLPEFAQIHVHWVGDATRPSHSLPPSSPPTFSLSQYQGLLQWVGSSHQVAKVLELQLHHQSFQLISVLISFRVGWLDLLAVQGTLKSLLQHQIGKYQFFWHLAFFMVQLSHPYMTTGKIIALTRRIFDGKMMSLLLNMLSRFVVACLPRRKCFLISWLRSLSVVILEPKKIKSVSVSPQSWAYRGDQAWAPVASVYNEKRRQLISLHIFLRKFHSSKMSWPFGRIISNLVELLPLFLLLYIHTQLMSSRWSQNLKLL